MQMFKLLLLVPSFSLVALSCIGSAFAETVPDLANSSISTVESLRSQGSHRSIDLLSIPSQVRLHQNQGVIAQTEDKSEDSDEPEEEITVTGKSQKINSSTTPTYIVPKSEIEQLNPSTAAELLRNLPGFAINDYGFGADIHTGTFLRGFSINQSTFQVNGRSFGSNVSTYHGGTDLNSIPVDAIERVELTSGTSATLYGSEAFGGTINLVTKKEPQPLKATAGIELGSYGYQRYRLGYGGTVDGVNLRLGYERFSTDNNYPVPAGAANRGSDGRLFNGDSRVDNFYGSVDVPVNDRNSLSVDAYKTASRRGLLYFGFPLQRDRLDHDLLNIGTTLTTKLGDGNDSILKSTISFNQDFFNTYGPSAGGFRSGSLDSKALSGRLENQWQVSPNYKLTSGLDIVSSSIRGDVLSNNPALISFNGIVNRDRFSLALFALNTFQLDPNFLLELGLRQNLTSEFGSYLNPTVGTSWKITPDLTFRNSFAVLQRNPGLDQLYVFDTVHNWRSNPNLVPEKGVAYTAGIDWRVSDQFLAQLSYFGSNLSDRLGIIARRWENVGQVNTNGIEAALKLQITPEFSSFLNYTYTDAKIASSKTASEVGLQLATIPYSVAKLGVSYVSNGWQANLFFNYYSGSRRAIFAASGVRTTEFSPSYLSLDLNSKIPLASNLALTINLENLTDRSYEKSNRIFQPGLTYRIGLQASF